MEFSHFLFLYVPSLEISVQSWSFLQQIFTGPQLFNTADTTKKKHKNPSTQLAYITTGEADNKQIVKIHIMLDL